MKFAKDLLVEMQTRPHWAACEPRRYVPPHGYLNPKFNSLNVAAVIALHNNHDLRNTVEQVGLLIAWKLIDASMPTIFVGEDFLRAICITDPPADMQLSELHWPFEAMTFVLPEQFQKDHFQAEVPFLRAARLDYGDHYQPTVLNQFFRRKIMAIENSDKQARMGTWFTGNLASWADYTGTYPFNTKVSEMLDDYPFVDHIEGQHNNPKDKEMTRKAVSVLTHLILAMNAVPEFECAPRLARPKKEKHGRVVRDELWHPATFGWDYKMKHEHSEPQGGHHASPRLHPRRGHWRHQRFGKALSQTKVIWIEPVLVGVK